MKTLDTKTRQKARTLLQRRMATLVLLIITVLPLAAAPGPSLRLLPGFPVQNSVPLDGDNRVRSFNISVPEDAFEMHIALTDSRGDLDLYLYDAWGELVYLAEESFFNEELVLSRTGNPSLRSGSYTLDVVYQLSRPPVLDGYIARSLDFSLRMDFIRVPEARQLEPGQRYDLSLSPEQGMFDYFRFTLPEDSTRLRVDVFNSDADIDFALQPAEGFTDPYEALLGSTSYLANEHQVFEIAGLESREFYLMVYTGSFEDRPIDYSLRVSPDSEAAADLQDLDSALLAVRQMSRFRGLDRAMAATVELATESGGGSGCLISPRGHILTNHHVIQGDDGEPSPRIAVAMTTDPRKVSAEMFLAEPVYWDARRDIALIRIVSGLYGQPIPEFPGFPYFEHGNIDELTLGENINMLGYPAVGGLGSKVTITYTRGVISGFEDIGFGLMIKTDGEVNYGNSGGAAVDESYRLLGLPTQINPDAGGKIAYIHSLDMVPEQWFREAGIIP